MSGMKMPSNKNVAKRFLEFIQPFISKILALISVGRLCTILSQAKVFALPQEQAWQDNAKLGSLYCRLRLIVVYTKPKQWEPDLKLVSSWWSIVGSALMSPYSWQGENVGLEFVIHYLLESCNLKFQINLKSLNELHISIAGLL